MNWKLLKLTPILLLLGCTPEQVVTNYAFPSSCLSGDKLDTYETELDNLWDAMDELYKNPLK